jgi:hypothetical protein
VLSIDEALQCLRELDDPVNVERPESFDPAATAARFATLVEYLDSVFVCRCATDAGPDHVQDASFYGTIIIPAAATNSGADIAIRVSNFGTLAVYAIEQLGVYDDAERDVLLDPGDRARVETALADTGHVVVPESVLWNEYDGANDSWKTHFADETTPTWFVRYFDWV